MHGSIGRSDVLSAIHEIIINLIGCEELVVLEINANGSALHLSSSFGIEAGPYHRVELGAGIIGDCAVSRRTYITGDEWDGTRTSLGQRPNHRSAP